MQEISILLLEDSALDAELITAQVRKSGVQAEITRVIAREEFETALRSGNFDLILSDYALPDFDGMSALEMAAHLASRTPFIFVSGTLGEDVAIDSLQNGAVDYVLKHRLERLAPAVRRAIAEKSERQLRLRREQELQESEANFRELADALPQLVWTADNEGHITFRNRHAQQYSGDRAVQSMAGLEITHPGDREAVIAECKRHFSNRSSFEIEYRLLRSSDHSYRWHLVRFVPRRNAENATNGWLTTAVDVEEQRRREEALRRSEEALLRANETLEDRVQERTEAYRSLSGRLLHIQDTERRKIARELHDSLGQYLSGLKINFDIVSNPNNGVDAARKAELLSQSVQILDSCIREARTTSYLLHPPLLDEAGFAHAAQWYVDGFGERSGIRVALSLPQEFDRLPTDVEIVLFRVLQESLTNVHRHSGSPAVDIEFEVEASSATLQIQDYGCGIPKDRLKLFKESKNVVGVGLAGMRERARELGGSLEISCDGQGTRVVVLLPIRRNENSRQRAASDVRFAESRCDVS